VKEQLNNEAQPLKAGLNEDAAKRMAQDVLRGLHTPSANITSGLNAGQNPAMSPITVKQTDYKTLTGSNPGDHRAQAAGVKMPDNPGPREQMTQFPLSGRTPDAPKPMTPLDESNIGG